MLMNATTRPGGRIYYGWIMMILCMVTLMLMVGTTTNAFPLYVLPVSQSYGLSRANTNSGMILMNAGSALSALVVGRMLDLYSARVIMGLSAAILAACLVTLGLARNIWISAAVIFLPVGFAMTGIGSLTAPALVARWFVVHRGRAMAITMMGNSLGTILMVPPLAWLIDRVGWRHSLVTLGLLVAVIVAALLPFVRNAPGPNDSETGSTVAPQEPIAGEVAPADRLSSRQLFASARFWAIGLSTSIAMGAFQGVIVSLVPMGRGMGFSNPAAAGLISILGLAAILAKMGIAFIGDRFSRVVMLAGAYVLMAVSSIVFLTAHGYAAMVIGCVLLGLAAGVTMPLYLALLADQFGTRSFGNANGNITFLIAVLGAGAIRFSGEVFDRTGGYGPMFALFSGLVLVAAVLVISLRRKPPAAALPIHPAMG